MPLDLILIQETAGQVWGSAVMAACHLARVPDPSQCTPGAAQDDDDEPEAQGMQLSVALESVSVHFLGLIHVLLYGVSAGFYAPGTRGALACVSLQALRVLELGDTQPMVCSSRPDAALLQLSVAKGRRGALADIRGPFVLAAPCGPVEVNELDAVCCGSRPAAGAEEEGKSR